MRPPRDTLLRMREPILVLNAGSSSVKFSIFETRADRSVSAGVHGQIEGIGTGPRLEVSDAKHRKLEDRKLDRDGFAAAIATIQDWFSEHVGNAAELSGVGHRVVHGGVCPWRSDRAAARIGAPPKTAGDERRYRSIYCYGFHGISYEYMVSALPLLAPECVGRKLIVAHLGNGASMCAIDGGRSIATTMGFQRRGRPADGNAHRHARSGRHPLLQHENMTPDAVEHLIYEQSGLLGVSGISSDGADCRRAPRPRPRRRSDC
jgi:acetate kinase